MKERDLSPEQKSQRRNELASVAVRQAGSASVPAPANFRDMLDFAQLISQSNTMVAPHFRQDAGSCYGLVSVAMRFGLDPFQLSWKTYKVKGEAPLAYEAQAVVAMVNAGAPLKSRLRYFYDGQGPTRQCRVVGTFIGEDEPLEYVSPRIADIKPQNSPLWKTDPDQQLGYYSARAWARRHCPDVLLGVITLDEAEGYGPDNARDVTPKTAEPGQNHILATLPAAEDQGRSELPSDEHEAAGSLEADAAFINEVTAPEGEPLPGFQPTEEEMEAAMARAEAEAARVREGA